MKFVVVVLATIFVVAKATVICPGGMSECPVGNTCCHLSSGQYGCCPLPNAVCCSGSDHCCPAGYICDVSAGTCTSDRRSIPAYKKITASPILFSDTLCPDRKSECPMGTKCCKLASGSYGCCL